MGRLTLTLTLTLLAPFAGHAPQMSLSTTAYCQGTITASGRHVFLGEVAMNTEPIGTRIVVSPPVFGKRHFIVLDRYGSGTQLDFYNASCVADDEYGRRVERVRVISRGRPVSKGRPSLRRTQPVPL